MFNLALKSTVLKLESLDLAFGLYFEGLELKVSHLNSFLEFFDLNIKNFLVLVRRPFELGNMNSQLPFMSLFELFELFAFLLLKSEMFLV